MALSTQIIQEAMKWRGARYHHAACLPYLACDCIGLVIGIAKAVGCLPPTFRPPVYSPQWHVHRHQEVLQETMEQVGCRRVPLDDRRPGTILLFQYGRVSSHAAILVAQDPEYLVHALLGHGVRHHRLAGDLLARLRGCYAFPEGTP